MLLAERIKELEKMPCGHEPVVHATAWGLLSVSCGGHSVAFCWSGPPRKTESEAVAAWNVMANAANFTRIIIDALFNDGGFLCGWMSEEGQELMQMAEKYGLVRRAEYDPAVHGDVADSEPGDMIWVKVNPVAEAVAGAQKILGHE